jgi:5-methylcytosine-specific restriction endonuclease McrA
VRLGDTGGTIDHLTPIVAGGRTVESNCVLACAPCNAAKGQHTLTYYKHLCGVAAFAGEK